MKCFPGLRREEKIRCIFSGAISIVFFNTKSMGEPSSIFSRLSNASTVGVFIWLYNLLKNRRPRAEIYDGELSGQDKTVAVLWVISPEFSNACEIVAKKVSTSLPKVSALNTIDESLRF